MIGKISSALGALTVIAGASWFMADLSADVDTNTIDRLERQIRNKVFLLRDHRQRAGCFTGCSDLIIDKMERDLQSLESELDSMLRK